MNRENVLSEVTKSNIHLEKVCNYSWNLSSYIESIVSTSESLITGINQEKFKKLQVLINQTCNKYWIKTNIEKIPSIINTWDHFWVLSTKTPFFQELIYARFLELTWFNEILSLSWENVSLNNPSFPRGIVINNNERIPLIANRFSSFTFSDFGIHFKDKKTLEKEIITSSLPNYIKDWLLSIILSHSSNEIFTVIIKINLFIWNKLYWKKLYILPLVEIIRQYIYQNSSIFQDIFLKNKSVVEKYFTNKIWWYFINEDKINWTTIWYIHEKNNKWNRIIKKPILVDKQWYYHIEWSNKTYLPDWLIIEYIYTWKLQISLSVAYIMLIDIWLLPLGWTSQVQYMATFIKYYEQISWKNMEKQKEWLVSFWGFTFWDFSLEEACRTHIDYTNQYKKRIKDLLDIEFLRMVHLQ